MTTPPSDDRPRTTSDLSRATSGARIGAEPAWIGSELQAPVLAELLARHPELVEEARSIALSLRLAREPARELIVAWLLDADHGELRRRAARPRNPYRTLSEAAGEILQELLAPFVAELERRVTAHDKDAALAFTLEILRGLWRLRDAPAGSVVALSDDFPLVAARTLLQRLGGTSERCFGSAWRLPETSLSEFGDWGPILRATNAGPEP